MFYRVLFSLVVYLGCTQTLNLVWSFSDIANALMAIPNLICMLILSKEVAQDIKAFQPEIDNRHTEKRSEQNTYVQDVKKKYEKNIKDLSQNKTEKVLFYDDRVKFVMSASIACLSMYCLSRKASLHRKT